MLGEGGAGMVEAPLVFMTTTMPAKPKLTVFLSSPLPCSFLYQEPPSKTDVRYRYLGLFGPAASFRFEFHVATHGICDSVL